MNLKIEQIGTQEKLSGRIVRFSLLIRPEDQTVFSLRGRVCAVFEVDTTGAQVEKSTLKKIAEDIFLQNYFTASFLSNEGGLKETLKKIGEHFEGLKVKQVSFVTVVILQDYIYMARKGNCCLAYYRSGNLLSVKGITADTGKLQFTSGLVTEGDVLGLTAGHLERDADFKGFLKRLQALDPVKSVAVFLYFEKDAPIKPLAASTPPDSNYHLFATLRSRLDLWKQDRSKAIYIKSNGVKARQKAKKGWRMLLLFLIILLIGSTVFTIYKTRQRRRALLLGSVLGQSALRIAEAEDLLGLNNQKARDILEGIKKDLSEAQGLADKDQKEEVEQVEIRVAQLMDKANNVTRLGEENIFYDLGLKDPEAVGKSICSVSEGLFVADKRGRLWFLNTADNIEVDILGDKTYPALAGAACGDDLAYMATIDSIDKVSFSAGNFSVTEGILGENKPTAGFSDFCEYADNLYFLEGGSGQIIKFIANAQGYSSGDSYLKEGQAATGGISLAIDGDVYVANKEAVDKYTAGSKTPWEAEGAPSSPRDFAKVYTSSSLDSLYLLNQASNEIWIFNKEGYYQGLAVLENNAPINDFSVEEATLFVLSGSKVYRAEL